jgi:hypothetical protein
MGVWLGVGEGVSVGVWVGNGVAVAVAVGGDVGLGVRLGILVAVGGTAVSVTSGSAGVAVVGSNCSWQAANSKLNRNKIFTCFT